MWVDARLIPFHSTCWIALSSVFSVLVNHICATKLRPNPVCSRLALIDHLHLPLTMLISTVSWVHGQTHGYQGILCSTSPLHICLILNSLVHPLFPQMMQVDFFFPQILQVFFGYVVFVWTGWVFLFVLFCFGVLDAITNWQVSALKHHDHPL